MDKQRFRLEQGNGQTRVWAWMVKGAKQQGLGLVEKGLGGSLGLNMVVTIWNLGLNGL